MPSSPLPVPGSVGHVSPEETLVVQEVGELGDEGAVEVVEDRFGLGQHGAVLAVALLARVYHVQLHQLVHFRPVQGRCQGNRGKGHVGVTTWGRSP